VVAILVKRGEITRATKILFASIVLIAISSVWAFTIGGSQVTERLSSLVESNAANVYYTNRGVFLEDTIFNTIPKYPLGAGLGRWGMVYSYFGDKSSLSSSALWAEIQPTAWIYDGGVPLLLVYYSAIIACVLFSYRIATNRQNAWGDLAIVVFAHNIAILANTFSYVPFIGQSGLYFWLLNAGLMAGVMRSNSEMARELFHNA